MIGQTVSNYRILEKLGEGGMGVVYKAKHQKLGSFVAIKFLSPRFATQEAAKKRFIQEAKAASSLEHPNICTVYDIGETEGGGMFIVMPYYEGETLRERIERNPLDFDEAIGIATQIASGLAKAHANGITHRDIKPANIFLTSDGYVKILDFGLAKLAGQSRLTMTGTTVGTVRYMSPEQAKGEEIDPSSDVFSLGGVFYELLTGAVPFDSDHEQAVIYRIINENPEPLSHHRADFPPSAQRVIDKALAKNREERYPSASELLADLEKLKRGHEVTAIRRRPRRASIGLGALFGMIALAAGYLVYSQISSPDAGNEPVAVSADVMAVFPFSVKGGEEYGYLGEGMVDLMNMCIDGAGDLAGVDSQALLKAVSREGDAELDQETSESVARSLGAGLFVRGNLLEAGGRFQATATLYVTGGEAKLTARAMVDQESQVFELAQDLARQFLVDLTGGESEGGVGGVDTSFEALRAFLEGERKLRRGEFEAAVESYKKAVAVDSSLARAWARLAWTAAYTPYMDLGREASRRALELSDRLSTRDRSLLEANDAYYNGRLDEAEQLLGGLLKIHPTDGMAWMSLADVLLANAATAARPFDEVIDALDRAVAVGVREETALINRYWASAAGGKHDRALECLERYLELNPKGDNAAWFRTILAFQKGNAEDRNAAIEQLMQVEPGYVVVVLQNLTWFENFSGAARVARIFTEASTQPEFRARGYIELAQIDLAQGKWDSAQANLDAAGLPDPADALEYRALFSAAPFLETSADELRALCEELERWDPEGEPAGATTHTWITPHERVHPHLRIYLLGLLSARLGDQEKAAQYADDLESLDGNADGAALARHLPWCVRAYIDVAADNREAALEKLERGRIQGGSWEKRGVSGFFSQMHERYARAELLRAEGRYRDALRWYETAGRNASCDVIYLAPSYLRRAEVCERLGEKKRAVELYGRFLEIWRECDPGLRPQLEQARQALDRLQSSS